MQYCHCVFFIFCTLSKLKKVGAHQCSLLSNSFCGCASVLQISRPQFLYSNNFSEFISYLLTSNFFCLSYKFVMKFSLSITCVSSFFCFLGVDTGSSHSGKILSLLESVNLSSDSCRYSERFYCSVSTQSAMLRSPHWAFLSWNVQSVNVTLWMVHCIYHYNFWCFPAHNFQFIFCSFKSSSTTSH